jgi:hypothetical protein
MDAANTSFDGWYKQLPLSLTSDENIVVNYEDCSYVYKIEENFDRDGDGLPDFLGARGNVTDVVSVGLSKAVSNVISGLRPLVLAVISMGVVAALLRLKCKRNAGSVHICAYICEYMAGLVSTSIRGDVICVTHILVYTDTPAFLQVLLPLLLQPTLAHKFSRG